MSDVLNYRYSGDEDEYADPRIRIRSSYHSTASSFCLALSLALITFASCGLNVSLGLHTVITTETKEPIAKNGTPAESTICFVHADLLLSHARRCRRDQEEHLL